MKTARLLFALAISFAFTLNAIAQTTWSLQSCIDHAFEHNIQIKQSELDGTRAQVNTLSAQGNFLPSLNASGSHGYNIGTTIDPFTNDWATDMTQSNNFGLSTGILLFNGFRNHLILSRAKLGQELAAANLESTQNDVALSISAAYLNILFQEEFVKLAKVNLETSRRQVDRVSKLVEAGASPAADLLDVKAQEATDAASLISSENALMLAKLNLVQMLQLPGDKASDFEVESPDIGELEVSPIPLTAKAAVSHAMNFFPQIRAAEFRVEDAELAKDIANTSRIPRISGSYNIGSGYSGNRRQGVGELIYEPWIVGSDSEGNNLYGVAADENMNLFTPNVGEYSEYESIPFFDQLSANVNQSIFFSLSVPIFNGFSVKNNVELARLNMIQSEYAMESTKQALRTSIESAWADAKAAQNTLAAQEAALTSAELAFANTELRFEAGAVSALEYADARNRLDNARINAMRTRYDLVFKSKILDFYQGKAITL
ncbi:MAG: hypothetical protein CMB32_03160 [Euryarchaeota archaeon]|nr:hypothetical protein [Euryarchaeota archaeon]|tara:strand:- start:4042 stop:5508 length:1467 start_codon:yes stop_codon:yes gene_type:complete